MSRQPRLLLAQSYYHVMTRGNNRLQVFRCEEDYDYYLYLLGKYKTKHPFDLFHYCLMPSHVHLDIRTRNALDFSIFMKKINLAYFHYFRSRYGWIGHFWQDRFKSQPIGKDSYFIQCGKYIELNPVRKGLVIDPKDYKYSSYNHYAFGKENKLITCDPFYYELGPNELLRQEKYRDQIISDVVLENYSKNTWGSKKQRYNEAKKVSNHLNLVKLRKP